MRPWDEDEEMIDVTINGKSRSVAPERALSGLLEDLEVAAETVVIEHNGKVIPRDRFAETPVVEGDEIELIRLMGGG